MNFGGTLTDDGLIYYCRRKYLAGMGRNNFQPPRELKTSGQLRRECIMRKEQERANQEENANLDTSAGQGGHHVHFQTPAASNGTSVLKGIFAPTPKSQSTKIVPIIEKSTGGSKIKKAAQLVMMTHIDKPSAHNVIEADWVEDYRGGICFYVNKRTGDVTTKCPWLPSQTVFEFSNTQLKQPQPQLQYQQTLQQQRPHTSSGLPSSKSAPSLTINTSNPLLVAGSQTFTSSSLKHSSSSTSSRFRKKAIATKDSFFEPLRTTSWRRLVPVNEDFERGTGSLVYKQEEMEEFLRLLDRLT